MKRLMIGLTAGALVAAMLPGVTSAKSDNAAVITTDGVCQVQLAGWQVTGTSHEVTTSAGNGMAVCKFGPDDFTPAPPAGGYRDKGGGIHIVISPSGHGHFTMKL